MNTQSKENESKETETQSATNSEYKSPDTELKFLEALVKEDVVTSNNFKITKGAFNKAMTYAKAIGQLAGTGMECYGYLLKPADSLDNTVTDIFLAPNQTNQSAYVRVSAEGVYQSSQEIEPKGKMIVGWWHSHGTFSTFHSGTDVNNFEVVLHSIAPRTMYKNEKGQYTYNPETKELLVNGTKIRGIELQPNAQLDILRKVEQDPYAYSMVVNMRRSYYLEKLTKRLISREDGFVLNPPIRPALELVNTSDDVKYTISEIEDDITSKVDINEGYSRYSKSDSYSNSHNGFFQSPRSSRDKTYRKSFDWDFSKNKVDTRKETLSKFVDTLKSGTPEYLSEFLEGIVNKEKSLLSKLSESSDNSSAKENSQISNKTEKSMSKTFDLEELSNSLIEKFENVKEKYSTEKSYDIQRLRDEVTWHLISEYSKNPSPDTVKKYAELNNTLSNDFNVAVNAGKALAKYSMERFTDYNNESNHKYRNFIGHFLDNLNTKDHVTISASLKISKNSKYDQATERLFLYNDRLDIINNILTALSFKTDELKFKPFLSEFAEEYQKNPASKKLDSIIEQKLLPIVDSGNLGSYVDRASYERIGVLNRIFGGVRNYFGGV